MDAVLRRWGTVGAMGGTGAGASGWAEKTMIGFFSAENTQARNNCRVSLISFCRSRAILKVGAKSRRPQQG